MNAPATSHHAAYIQSALQKSFKPEQIAAGLGISVERVNQVMAAHGFTVGSSSEKAASLDELYDDLEELTAKKLHTKLKAVASAIDPMKLTVILTKLNSLKRRSHGEGQGVVGKTASLVSLELPKQLQQNIKVVTNAQNEVVAVDGRQLSTISRESLQELAAKRAPAVTNYLLEGSPVQPVALDSRTPEAQAATELVTGREVLATT